MVKNQHREMLKNQILWFKHNLNLLAYLVNQKLFQQLNENGIFVMRPPKSPKATRGKEYIEEIKYEYENKISKLNDKMNKLRWLITELEQTQFESLKCRDK